MIAWIRLAVVVVATVALAACDPLVEEPSAPRAVLVSPTSGDLVGADKILVEVALPGCDALERIEVLADGMPFATRRPAEDFLGFDPITDACTSSGFCIVVESSGLLAIAPTGEVDLVVETVCAADGRIARTEALEVAFSPFAFASLQVQSGPPLELVPAGPGELLVTSRLGIASVKYALEDVRVRPALVAAESRVWRFGDVVYYACGRSSCGDLLRFDAATLEQIGLPLEISEVGCESLALLERPDDERLVFVKACEDSDITVDLLIVTSVDRDLSNPVEQRFIVEGLDVVSSGVSMHPDGGTQAVGVSRDGRASHVRLLDDGSVETTLLPMAQPPRSARLAVSAFSRSGDLLAVANTEDVVMEVFDLRAEPASIRTASQSPPFAGFGVAPDEDVFLLAGGTGFTFGGIDVERSESDAPFEVVAPAPRGRVAAVSGEGAGLSVYSAAFGTLDASVGGLPPHWRPLQVMATPDGWTHVVFEVDEREYQLVHYPLEAP